MGKRHIIHEAIRKNHPQAFKKAKKFSSFKYPKLFFLIILVILSYFIFSGPKVSILISELKELSYIGIFLSGMLISFGFSAPFAIGFLLISQPSNIFLAAIIGGIGGMIADLIIFKTIKFSFMNEFKSLEETKTIKLIEETVDKNINIKIRHYLLYLFAGIIIATPLPDELGVSILAGMITIKPKIFALISFLLHTIIILILLGIW